jgi:DNA-binding SARP family transcriptional activator
LEVVIEGRTLPLGAPKQRAILAILLLSANEVVSTDDLMERLWGEQPPETAAKALQVHVSNLRKALEPGRTRGEPHRLLVTRPPGYLIAVEPGHLDLDDFEAKVASARAALKRGQNEEASSTLRDALDIWRGRVARGTRRRPRRPRQPLPPRR